MDMWNYRFGSCFVLLMMAQQAWAGQDDVTVKTAEALFARSAVDDDALDQARGGAVQTYNLMNLDATLTNNTANRNISGNNTITNGAFANANGLSTVIQNSGNNVIIQNATILNLDLR